MEGCLSNDRGRTGVLVFHPLSNGHAEIPDQRNAERLHLGSVVAITRLRNVRAVGSFVSPRDRDAVQPTAAAAGWHDAQPALVRAGAAADSRASVDGLAIA